VLIVKLSGPVLLLQCLACYEQYLSCLVPEQLSRTCFCDLGSIEGHGHRHSIYSICTCPAADAGLDVNEASAKAEAARTSPWRRVTRLIIWLSTSALHAGEQLGLLSSVARASTKRAGWLALEENKGWARCPLPVSDEALWEISC
jgi:hypothetical protein